MWRVFQLESCLGQDTKQVKYCFQVDREKKGNLGRRNQMYKNIHMSSGKQPAWESKLFGVGLLGGLLSWKEAKPL